MNSQQCRNTNCEFGGKVHPVAEGEESIVLPIDGMERPKAATGKGFKSSQEKERRGGKVQQQGGVRSIGTRKIRQGNLLL